MRLAKGEVMCGRCGNSYQSNTAHDCPASVLTDVNPPLVSSMFISGHCEELLDVTKYSCRTCQRSMFCSYPDVPQRCPFCFEELRAMRQGDCDTPGCMCELNHGPFLTEAQAAVTPHPFSGDTNGPCVYCGHLQSYKFHTQENRHA